MEQTTFEVDGLEFVETLEEQSKTAMNGGYRGYITGPQNKKIEFCSGWYDCAEIEKLGLACDSYPMMYSFNGKRGHVDDVWKRIEAHKTYIKNLIQAGDL